MIDFGIVRPGTKLYIPFATYDSNDPSASVTMSGFATTDIEIYKDGSTTQRGSDNGYALLDTDGTDFDSLTGIHGFSVDLADNTTAGFYAAGSQYFVVVSSITVDSATVSFIAARFTIGYPDAMINTTIATLASQTSFTLTAGPAEDNALIGCPVVIHDVASAVQCGFGVISAYTGSTKTVTLTAQTTFSAAATDNISIYPPSNSKWFASLVTAALPLTPTTAGRTLDVSAGGEAGVDWANVGSPTTILNLSATTIKTATDVELDTNILISGVNVTGVNGSGIVASSGENLSGIPWNAAWDAEVQSECTDALNAYDPPTNAEMEARTLVATGYATAANQATIAGYIDTEVSSILAAIGNSGEGLSGIPTVNSNIVSVEGDETPIDGKSLAAALRYIAAICAGKISGAQTGQETFKGLDGTTTRVVVDVDESGNRTSVTYD